MMVMVMVMVMVTPDPRPRPHSPQVADFGQSQQLFPGQTFVNSKVYGALTHMAPEVLGQNRMSRAADVYSWGVILWQVRV